MDARGAAGWGCGVLKEPHLLAVARSYRPRFAERDEDHLIACGLIGLPVPPVMISGGPEKKNS